MTEVRTAYIIDADTGTVLLPDALYVLYLTSSDYDEVVDEMSDSEIGEFARNYGRPVSVDHDPEPEDLPVFPWDEGDQP